MENTTKDGGNHPNSFSDEWLTDSAVLCYDVICERLCGRPRSNYPHKFKGLPLFVTWYLDDNLRGCIGTFEEPRTMEEGLEKYALSAALNDTRFSPMTKRDLREGLDCHLSILYDFQTSTMYGWTIGVHGIRCTFQDDKWRKYEATFLPEVAKTHKWDHDMTYLHLKNKSGAPKDAMMVSIITYKSKKFSLDFTTYQRLQVSSSSDR
ncbi:hypothetical protein SNEBB_007388 [Seison nebaliae]|nr:hypothetical protein SNEBB_007388 [Seison nebaliae]